MAAAGRDIAAEMALVDSRNPGSTKLVQGTPGRIMCAVCGSSMQYNPSAMCPNCLKSRVDITEGLPKNLGIQHCKACGRYHNPPNHWIACQLESQELLQLCLKRVTGLDKVKLIDANFIWTEPHSKRLKVRLTIQKEVFTELVLQQSMTVEYIVHNLQCKNCHNEAAQIKWNAVVQVRQKVDHKRTFYLLEQLILKRKAHTQTLNVQEVPDGVDFFFLHKRHADKFSKFVLQSVPSRYNGTSEKVYAQDLNNNMSRARTSLSVEMVPLCKDDLICLHKRQHAAMGSVGPLVLCLGVAQSMKVIDPTTMQTSDLRTDLFFRNPLRPLMNLKQATEYTVIDVEYTGLVNDNLRQAELTLARTADLGVNDTPHVTALTHLGNLLEAGDSVLGYDLENAVFNEGEFDEWKRLRMPDVMVVKKKYPERQRNRRAWKLRALIKEEEEGGYMSLHKAKQDEYERFLEDVETDADLRTRINVYKDPERWRVSAEGEVVKPAGGAGAGGGDDGEEEEETKVAGVAVDEMLDDLVLGVDEEDEPEEEGEEEEDD